MLQWTGETAAEGIFMQTLSLYLYHLVYFVINGASSFVPKFYGEIGLTDGQIGILTSLPTLVALAFTPLFGAMCDRISKKRYLLSALLIAAAAFCFPVPHCAGFLPLFAVVSGYSLFSASISPTATTISLEHCRAARRDYGPIRLMGTVGYQLGTLLVGTLLTHSLKNLYPLMGATALAACAITFMMPNVEGHQHRQKRVPLGRLFADVHVRWLYVLIFFATISSQFYMSFYSKHLGDLGMSNATVSWIMLLSVVAELPFLYWGDKIARKTNIWNWLLIGIAANGIRWLGLALSRSAPAIILFQIPGVTVLACFEFFPALYLARRVPPELSGSAQNILTLTTFGAAKIVGSLIGGMICEHTGIPAMFTFHGAALLVGCGALWPITRKLIRTETVLSLSD